MRLAADTLAPQANAAASRRRGAGAVAWAPAASSGWQLTGVYGFAGTKPSCPMVMTLANPVHANSITTRRLSEASP